jgi:beta-phosphoglucomutase-like phosphatase (HAD superfamily)
LKRYLWFDLDGTLVDRVYQHILAWREALDEEGIEFLVWQIRRKIGMSGGLFANQLLRETGVEISLESFDRLGRRHAEAILRPRCRDKAATREAGHGKRPQGWWPS